MARRRNRKHRFPHTHETQRGLFTLTPFDVVDGFRDGYPGTK